jgi:aromatic-amino-acid transaminase
MLEKLIPAKADPILGLGKLYAADTRDNKIDLGVGVYKDADGNTPIMTAVKKAEIRLHESQTSKSYKGLAGDDVFRDEMRKLVLGDSVSADRVATLQAPGGTGALHQLFEAMKMLNPDATVWVSNPSWPSHVAMAKHLGFKTENYDYFDPATSGVDFDSLMASLQGMKAGDMLVLHGCCHNPTGANLSAEQWQIITDLVLEKNVMPLIDIAYQGFGDGLQ